MGSTFASMHEYLGSVSGTREKNKLFNKTFLSVLVLSIPGLQKEESHSWPAMRSSPFKL